MSKLLAVLLTAAAQPPPEPPLTALAEPARQAPAPPAAPKERAPEGSLAGTYLLEDGDPNTIVALELTADGRFQFAITAGALDARSAGRWTSDGTLVTLTTDPKPKAPEFAEGPVSRSGETPLLVKVNGPDGNGLAQIDVRVGFADGKVLEGYTQYDGWRPSYDEEEKQAAKPVAWVELALPMYNVAPKRFAVDPARGNAFTFTLVPNDFGVFDLQDEKFTIDPKGLRPADDARALFRRQ